MPSSSPVDAPDPANPDLATLVDPDDELDDPYIHTVSTEEFVEAVETASREEN